MPVAVAPIVLWQLGRAGRAGSRRAAAFVACSPRRTSRGCSSSRRSRARRGATTGSTTATGSTSCRCGSWASCCGSPPASAARRRGRDRRGRHAGAGARPAVRAAGERSRDRHRPGRALVADRVGARRAGAASARLALRALRAGAARGDVPPPRGIAVVALPLAVAGTFAAMSWFAWQRIIEAPEDKVFAGGLDRAWIDDRIPHNASVTKLYVDTAAGRRSSATRSSSPSSSTRRSIVRSTSTGRSRRDPAAERRRHLVGPPRAGPRQAPSSRIRLHTARPRAEGRRMPRDRANLALWRTDGPVRVVGASSNDALRRAVWLPDGPRGQPRVNSSTRPSPPGPGGSRSAGGRQYAAVRLGPDHDPPRTQLIGILACRMRGRGANGRCALGGDLSQQESTVERMLEQEVVARAVDPGDVAGRDRLLVDDLLEQRAAPRTGRSPSTRSRPPRRGGHPRRCRLAGRRRSGARCASLRGLRRRAS